MNPINNGALFLVSTLFDLYIFVLVVRLVLVYVHADYYNPISQFVVRLTQKLVTPLRKFLPNYKTIEVSTLLLIFIFELIKFLILSLLLSVSPNIFGLCLLAIADALKTLVNLFFYAILLQAILSWVQGPFHPASQMIAKITDPIMRPLHKLIPPIGGIDITPIPALIILQLLNIVLINPFIAYAQLLAFS